MKLSSFTASFHEYEYSLEYYHGKDVLHEGSLLIVKFVIKLGKRRNKILALGVLPVLQRTLLTFGLYGLIQMMRLCQFSSLMMK